MSLLYTLRNKRYDIGIITVENTLARKSNWIYLIMKIAGCKKLIGSGEARLDINIDIPPRTHYFDRINRYLKKIGVDEISDYNSIADNALPIDWAISIGINKEKQTVAIITGVKAMASKKHSQGEEYDVKSWGFENWIELSHLLSNKGLNVILIGGKNEKMKMESDGIVVPAGEGIINMVGKTSILESLALLKISNLVIGGEGGMVHCAAAIGINTLTIFGGTDYKVFEPRGGKIAEIIVSDIDCYPCYGTEKAVQCEKHRCLESISVRKVYEKVNVILDMENALSQ